jgi:hypothetical protein
MEDRNDKSVDRKGEVKRLSSSASTGTPTNKKSFEREDRRMESEKRSGGIEVRE